MEESASLTDSFETVRGRVCGWGEDCTSLGVMGKGRGGHGTYASAYVKKRGAICFLEAVLIA